MADADCTVQQPHGNPDEQPNGMTGYTTHLAVASTEQSPKFVPFPNELILMIFELLPQHALRQLRLVNRATNALLPSPPRMVLRNSCQNALYEEVTEALNAPPDSIENVRKLAIVTTNDRKEKICGYWIPNLVPDIPHENVNLVPAIYKLIAKLNSKVEPQLTGLHMNLDGLTVSQLIELNTLLLGKPEEKWTISTLNLVGDSHDRLWSLAALIDKVEMLTAVEINHRPYHPFLDRVHPLWRVILDRHATSLQKVSCAIDGELNDAITQTVYLRRCSNLKWLVLKECRLEQPQDHPYNGLWLNWTQSYAFWFVKAICRLPSLKQLAIVISGRVGIRDEAAHRARQAIQDVMEGARHLDRFRICGPAYADSGPLWLEKCWEGCRTPSGEVVITEEITDWRQNAELGWHHVRF